MSGWMAGDYIAVVGGVNLDICGKPDAPIVARDSNPGRVTTALGGVGRNIAHNMTLLGLKVSLVTALGEDAGAQRVEESCHALGIDLSHALRLPGAATSTYVFLTDHMGEMELAVSDMAIYDHLTAAYLARQMDFLNEAKLVVADTNIPAESLDHLARHCAAPLFVDPVSTAKAAKVKPILGRLHTLKANALEAELLSGVKIGDEVSLQVAAGALLDTGLKRVFISLGPDGVLAAEPGGMARLPIIPGEMKNATGCGDAFMAALAWAWLRELPLADAARAGLAAAAIALAGEATINPAMSPQGINKLIDLHKEEFA